MFLLSEKKISSINSVAPTFEMSLFIITEDAGEIANILFLKGTKVAFQVATIKAPELYRIETA